MLDSIIKFDAVTVDDVVVMLVIDREIRVDRQQFVCLVICHRAEQRLRVRRPDDRRLVLARKIGHYMHGGTFGVKIMIRSDLSIRDFIVHHVFVISLPEGFAIPHGWQCGLVLHGQIRSANKNENV